MKEQESETVTEIRVKSISPTTAMYIAVTDGPPHMPTAERIKSSGFGRIPQLKVTIARRCSCINFSSVSEILSKGYEGLRNCLACLKSDHGSQTLVEATARAKLAELPELGACGRFGAVSDVLRFIFMICEERSRVTETRCVDGVFAGRISVRFLCISLIHTCTHTPMKMVHPPSP